MTASTPNPAPTDARASDSWWSRQTLMAQAGIAAAVLLAVALVGTIVLSSLFAFVAGIFIAGFVALVLWIAATAIIFYLAYRFGIDIVRQGILAADAERARRAPDTATE